MVCNLQAVTQRAQTQKLFRVYFLFHTHIYTQTHPALKCSVLYNFTHVAHQKHFD